MFNKFFCFFKYYIDYGYLFLFMIYNWLLYIIFVKLKKDVYENGVLIMKLIYVDRMFEVCDS